MCGCTARFGTASATTWSLDLARALSLSLSLPLPPSFSHTSTSTDTCVRTNVYARASLLCTLATGPRDHLPSHIIPYDAMKAHTPRRSGGAPIRPARHTTARHVGMSAQLASVIVASARAHTCVCVRAGVCVSACVRGCERGCVKRRARTRAARVCAAGTKGQEQIHQQGTSKATRVEAAAWGRTADGRRPTADGRRPTAGADRPRPLRRGCLASLAAPAPMASPEPEPQNGQQHVNHWVW